MVHGEISKKQKEDAWAWVEIGEPFPEGPVRVRYAGRPLDNQYVALWYKHGKPVSGRAWNNNGVVECSFPYVKAELTGKKDLGGKIQILSYEQHKEEGEAWADCGYVYRWVQWKNRKEPHQQLVYCGDTTVILMLGEDGEPYCGTIDLTTETAMISYKGGVKKQTTGIGELWTIVRDLRDPTPPPAPPPPKADEPPPPPPPPPKEEEFYDVWLDYREGDDFSKIKGPVLALDRPLKDGKGGTQKYFVALWYKHGTPVSGCIWNEGGKVAGSFASHGDEHNKKIGSLQVLQYNPKNAPFKLSWQPYKVAVAPDSKWYAVRVKNTAPCVMELPSGEEKLGKVELTEEKASYGKDGKEVCITGPKVRELMVLCRDTPVPGAKYPDKLMNA